MPIYQVVILALVQGFAEFLPISSSAHLALAPWLLTPGLVVIVAVLAFNLVGDGLRDASDPYSN